MKPSEMTLRPGVKLDFIHKKIRHLDNVSDTLSEYTYHTTTNYSRLDYISQPRQQQQQQDDEDVRSIATQDMLLDQKESQFVLDSQQISDLRKKIDIDSSYNQPLESSYNSQQPESSIHYQQPESNYNQQPESSYNQPESSYNQQKSSYKQQRESSFEQELFMENDVTRDKGKEREVITSPRESVYEQQQQQDKESLHLGSDWGDDWGDDYNMDNDVYEK